MRYFFITIFSCFLGAQTPDFGLHFGFAQSEGIQFGTLGLSSSWNVHPKNMIRARVDHAIWFKSTGSYGEKDANFDSFDLDWIFHPRSLPTIGFFFGAGIGSVQVKWNEAVSISGQSNRELMPHNENSTGLHVLVGGGFGSHLRIEGRIQPSFAGDTIKMSALGTIGWVF